MKDKTRQVEELQINEQELGKRKNWSALEIDSISTFWWKTLR